MISYKDIELVKKIFQESGDYTGYKEIKGLGEKFSGMDGDGSSRYHNVIHIEIEERTEQNGGKRGNQISPDFTIPLLEKGFVVINSNESNMWVKKVTPVLRWDLTGD